MLAKLLEQELEQRSQDGTYRRLRGIPAGLTDFASNDYLGVVNSGRLNDFVQTVLKDDPEIAGAGGSRLISGNTEQLVALEAFLADFYGTEAALVFPSGYDANLALISALGKFQDITLFYDEKTHASMRDGFRLARARSHHFRHNDLEDLEHKLQNSEKRPLIFVESVYSMDGDQAPLQELVELVTKYNGDVIVDEAHSSGVFGEHGEGLVSSQKFSGNVFARVHTWGKAHGTQGAVIATSDIGKEFLVNFARPFIYTTGVSNLSALVARCSYEVVSGANEERDRLNQLIACFCSEAKNSSAQVSRNASPIQTVRLRQGSTQDLRSLTEQLSQKNLFCVPIFHPTVPRGEERLRISLHAFNSEEEIRTLFSVLNEC